MTIEQHIAEGVLIIEREMSTVLLDESDPWGEFTDCRDLPVHPQRWNETVMEIAARIADWVADHVDELGWMNDEELRDLGQDMQLGMYGRATHVEDWPGDIQPLFDSFPEVVADPHIENTTTPKGDVPCVAFEIDRITYRY